MGGRAPSLRLIHLMNFPGDSVDQRRGEPAGAGATAAGLELRRLQRRKGLTRWGSLGLLSFKCKGEASWAGRGVKQRSGMMGFAFKELWLCLRGSKRVQRGSRDHEAALSVSPGQPHGGGIVGAEGGEGAESECISEAEGGPVLEAGNSEQSRTKALTFGGSSWADAGGTE